MDEEISGDEKDKEKIDSDAEERIHSRSSSVKSNRPTSKLEDEATEKLTPRSDISSRRSSRASRFREEVKQSRAASSAELPDKSETGRSSRHSQSW